MMGSVLLCSVIAIEQRLEVSTHSTYRTRVRKAFSGEAIDRLNSFLGKLFLAGKLDNVPPVLWYLFLCLSVVFESVSQ